MTCKFECKCNSVFFMAERQAQGGYLVSDKEYISGSKLRVMSSYKPARFCFICSSFSFLGSGRERGEEMAFAV